MGQLSVGQWLCNIPVMCRDMLYCFDFALHVMLISITLSWLLFYVLCYLGFYLDLRGHTIVLI